MSAFTNTDFTDFSGFRWTRCPKNYSVGDGCVRIVTEPNTDLWQRTYYGFRNDNAPLFQTTTSEEYFSFTVKTDFSGAKNRFDQCGIALYLDSENWLKGSIEYETPEFSHLGSIVTNSGYSDWSTVEIPADIKSMYYRLSRRASDFCIENSTDGINFHQMRITHLGAAGTGPVPFGIYACSPGYSSFKAIFSDFQLTECLWKAHS